MAPVPGPQPRLVSGTELRRRAMAASLELMRAAREHAHWSLQLAYAELRASHPTAAVITVELSERTIMLGQVVQVWDAAGRAVWSRHGTHHAMVDQFRPVDQLLAEVMRCRDVAMLPGWTDRGSGVYDVDLRALPPAIDPDPGGFDPDDPAPDPTGVSAVLADLFNTWYPHVVLTVREYARGLLEGRFAPLTDIARWPSVPAALGHPVPDGQTMDQHRPDEEDWRIGIGSVHGLAAGVVESLDSDEGHGAEDDLHIRVGVYSEELATRGLTVAALATAFRGDVRRTALAILQALPHDRPPTFPAMVPCTVCGLRCVLATAHRHTSGWVGDECCWNDPTRATE